MTAEQKLRLGAEIRRVRELRPKVSRQRVGDRAQIAEGTVRAVEAGSASEHSIVRVLDALAGLGRPVNSDVVAALYRVRSVHDVPRQNEARVRLSPATTEPFDDVGATTRLVKAALIAADPAERRELDDQIRLLVKGHYAELVARLDEHPER